PYVLCTGTRPSLSLGIVPADEVPQSMSGSAVSPTPSTSAASRDAVQRRLPIGAEPLGDARSHIRVWAPAAQRVAVAVAGGDTTPLAAEHDGYFSGIVTAGAGARYQIKLDDREQ